MCLEASVIYFGCTCRIQHPSNQLLAVQPCTSGQTPTICDCSLNGRSRFPILSLYTRFIGIRCANHIKAGADEIGEDGNELAPTVYQSVPEFLVSNAFDSCKHIQRVKGKIASEWRVAERLLSELKAHDLRKKKEQEMRMMLSMMNVEAKEERLKREEGRRKLQEEKANAEKATAWREAVERAAAEQAGGARMGALRPQVGSELTASVLRSRKEEASAHKVLEETTLKHGEGAHGARHVRFAPLPKRDPVLPPENAPRSSAGAPSSSDVLSSTRDTRHVHHTPLPTGNTPLPARNGAVFPNTPSPASDNSLPTRSVQRPARANGTPGSGWPAPRHSNVVSANRTYTRNTPAVAPLYTGSPSRLTVDRDMAALATASRDAAAPSIAASHPTHKIASSRGMLARPKPTEKSDKEAEDKEKEKATEKKDEEKGKHMTLDGVDLYE